MKKIVNILILAMMPLFLIAQAASPSADEILNKFFGKIDSQTLTSAFSITVSETANNPITYRGQLQMHGPRFTLAMLGNEGAYDGKTYYLYSEDANELTLTTPTPEELREANPILFARELQRVSRVRFSPAAKDAKLYVIDLIPNNTDAGIQKFTLKLRRSDLVPQEVTVREGQQTTVLRFEDAGYVAAVPNFVITKPGAFVNDLR